MAHCSVHNALAVVVRKRGLAQVSVDQDAEQLPRYLAELGLMPGAQVRSPPVPQWAALATVGTTAWVMTGVWRRTILSEE